MIWPIWIVVSLALSCGVISRRDGKKPEVTDASVGDAGSVNSQPDGDVFIPEGCVEVSRVIDGDTFDYRNGNGEDIRVRMLGINTRESGQTCYETGRNALSSLIRGKYIRLARDENADNKDQYGRELRYVTLCESTEMGATNLQMVRGGWGCVNEYWVEGLALEDALRDAQSEASRNRSGCWEDNSRFCSQ